HGFRFWQFLACSRFWASGRFRRGLLRSARSGFWLDLVEIAADCRFHEMGKFACPRLGEMNAIGSPQPHILANDIWSYGCVLAGFVGENFPNVEIAGARLFRIGAIKFIEGHGVGGKTLVLHDRQANPE